MMSQALGIIETLGLAAAIEAADTAVKSANVQLIGYEKSKGGGWITVKFCGDVGAVKAAISSGAAAAGKVSQVIATLILARPHSDLEPIIYSDENVPGKPENPPDLPDPTDPTEPEPPEPPAAEEDFPEEDAVYPDNSDTVPTKEETSAAEPSDTGEVSAPPVQEALTEEVSEETQEPENEPPTSESPAAEYELSEAVDEDLPGTPPFRAEAQQEATCNLCGDPACPRQKGDPHNNCIHTKETRR